MNRVVGVMRATILAVAVASTTGCELAPGPQPTPIGVAPKACGFGPSDPLGFKGETSLAEAGLPAAFGIDRDVRGTLYVTEGPKALPMEEAAEFRVFCMTLDDGSLVMGEVADGWKPPR